MPSIRQGRVPLQKRPYRHGWTERELNLVSHLRQIHDWNFQQIQKSFFPSLSFNAVRKAYFRLSPGDRVFRALQCHRASNTATTCIELGPCHFYTPISIPDTQSESTEISTITLSNSENDAVIFNHYGENRYNLRPNRPTVFPPKEPQYLVDRRRFPHFYKSYKHHLESSGLPDEDYCPPSRTPTPGTSDRSPSVISTQLSEASSLDLFGLEPCSVKSSSPEPSINSNSPHYTPSPEFFSAEEHLSSP
jgi:hypothetical protein